MELKKKFSSQCPQWQIGEMIDYSVEITTVEITTGFLVVKKTHTTKTFC